MNLATANLATLSQCDEELAKIVKGDIERIVADYLSRNMNWMSEQMVSLQMPMIERAALRALKNHLNNAGNIY